MAQADGTTPHIRDTTVEFLRSFSVVEYDSEAEEDFDVLSPIPDTVDGNTVHNSIELGKCKHRDTAYTPQRL